MSEFSTDIMRRQNVIEECRAGNVGKVAGSLIITENSR